MKFSEGKLVPGIKYKLKDVRLGAHEPSTGPNVTVGDLLILLMHPQIKTSDTIHVREGAKYFMIKEGKLLIL